jgi:hypothetical protein
LQSGENLKILGASRLTLELGSQCFEHPVVIVEHLMSPGCLLGSDFFSEHNCTINYETSTLSIGDLEVPVRRQEEEPKVCRIVLGRSTRIPANTEMILPGRVAKSAAKTHQVSGLVEAGHLQRKFTTGRSLASTDYGRIPVRVANLSEKPVFIHTNQTLGWFYPVSQVHVTEGLDEQRRAVTKEYVHPKQTRRVKGPKKPPEPGRKLAKETRPKEEVASKNTDDNPEEPNKTQVPLDIPSGQPAHALNGGEDNGARLTALLEKLEIETFGFDEPQTTMVTNLIARHQYTFSMSDFDLGQTTVVQHTIETGEAQPIKQRPRRVPPFQQHFVDETVKELLEKNLIKESQSPWSSPIVLAKKSDGSFRLCVDYRRLNSCTVKSAQPLPRIDDTLSKLSGSVYFSCLDCASGYWQVGVSPEDQAKTSFVTGVHQYEWRAMPFGLTGAPATFTRLMNRVLGDLEFCLVYLDDIIVHSSSFKEHVQQLEEVLSRLGAANLKLKPSKCKLFRNMAKFLGHVVTAEGISTDPGKVKKVAEWPQPTSVSEVRSFMGLATYYQKFVPDFANVAAPLHNLTRKNVPFVWSADCGKSFEELKQRLTTSPVLAYPDFGEGSGKFIVDTDASDFALGGVLSQEQSDGTERVIAYGSKTLQGQGGKC